jgi:cytochrome P450
LNAGHETTTNLIGNSLVAIAQHASARGHLLYLLEQEKSVGRLLPADLAQKTAFGGSFEPLGLILESSAAWDVAVDEFLRFESSNQLGNRRAVAEFELGGKRYPAGTLVTLCIGAANRDPAQFDAPDDLRLQREPNRHLAFGLGIHQCAGLSLARLEGRVAIRAFLERFPNFQLSGEPQRQRRARFRGFSQAEFTAL